jgi:hypothetical protein cdivTM_04820
MRNYAQRIVAYGLAVTMMIPGIAGASALGVDSSTAHFATIGDFLFRPVVARDDAASDRPTIAQPVVRLAAHTEHDALMIGALHTTDRRTVSAVELHNTTRQFAPLSDVALVVSVSTNHTDYVCRVNLQGYAPPQSSVRYYHPAVAPADGAQLQSCPSVPDGEQVTRYDVVLERSGATIDKASAAVDELAGALVWERTHWTAAARAGVFAKDFRARAGEAEVAAPYEAPGEPSLQILEVLPHPHSCDTAPDNCQKYVKVKNTGDQPIDLAAYRLCSGTPGSNSTVRNTSSLAGVIAPGQVLTIRAQANGAELAILRSGILWFEDQHGLVSFSPHIDAYSGAGQAAHQGKSWAYNSQTGTWQWTTPSPDQVDNIITNTPGSPQQPSQPSGKPCPAGQERNPATNRCRKINNGEKRSKQTAGSAKAARTASRAQKLTICKPGQERNPETGRCRAISVTGQRLAACKAGQYRNPATGRCRALAGGKASATVCKAGYYRNPATGRCKKLGAANSRQLTPCKPGWERNPSTNRCRKSTSKSSKAPAAGYAVEPSSNNGQTEIVWWMIGGVAIVAVGYAGWEWRSEIGQWLRRMVRKG